MRSGVPADVRMASTAARFGLVFARRGIVREVASAGSSLGWSEEMLLPTVKPSTARSLRSAECLTARTPRSLSASRCTPCSSSAGSPAELVEPERPALSPSRPGSTAAICSASPRVGRSAIWTSAAGGHPETSARWGSLHPTHRTGTTKTSVARASLQRFMPIRVLAERGRGVVLDGSTAEGPVEAAVLGCRCRSAERGVGRLGRWPRTPGSPSDPLPRPA
jgi:hypothetical protein